MPLYLSGYVEAFKDKYIHALEESQKKLNYLPIIEFMCHAILDSHYEMKKNKEAIVALPDIWLSRGNFRGKSAAEQALALLKRSPIITSEFYKKN